MFPGMGLYSLLDLNLIHSTHQLIRMPPFSGRMRCKSIRVGLRTRLKIDIKGRKKEEFELLDRRVEIIGGSSDGVWLDEGAQR
jgi:hypothetical protein